MWVTYTVGYNVRLVSKPCFLDVALKYGGSRHKVYIVWKCGARNS